MCSSSRRLISSWAKGSYERSAQRGSPPELECAPELLQCLRVVPFFECGPALCEQPLEAVAIELVGLQRDPVRAGDRPDGVGRQLFP